MPKFTFEVRIKRDKVPCRRLGGACDNYEIHEKTVEGQLGSGRQGKYTETTLIVREEIADTN